MESLLSGNLFFENVIINVILVLVSPARFPAHPRYHQVQISSATMASSAQAASASASGGGEPLIRVLNSWDVLLGRGLGSSKFEGNKRFRDEIVAPRKAEYNALDSYNEKARIAREVYDVVISRGGRFLKLANTEKAPRCVVKKGEWKVAPIKVALEKCKQSLREKTPSSPEQENSNVYEEGESESQEEESDDEVASGRENDKVVRLKSDSSYENVPGSSSRCASDTLPVEIGYYSTTAMSPFRAEDPLSMPLHGVLPNTLLGDAAPSFVAHPRLFQQLPHKDTQTRSDPVFQGQSNVTARVQSEPSIEETSVSEADEQEAVFALAAMAVADRPKFTEEQERIEQSSMTNEERVAALCDLFGRFSVAGTHQDKRARRDIDEDSLKFLIGQMRIELEQIPAERKQALLEAKEKCGEEEFSDDRLDHFLRVEGMNTKTAALRFVYYWSCRRDLFGPTKFTLPMTLSEAMLDDIPALEAGVYRILPQVDAFGRQLVLLDPKRNTGDGYTVESLLRAMWYTIEVAAQNCTDVRSGFVYIGWMKNCSVWDFGSKLFGRLSHYETHCWPMKFVAAHMCGSSNALTRIVSPVCKALMDRRGRSRMLIHDVSEGNVLEILAEFGIKKDMLPVEMGGSVRLTQAEWIANRRAVEMEEIH